MSKTNSFIPALLCLLFTSLVFSGCVAVTSDQLAGEPLSDAEYKVYEGSWKLDVSNDEGGIETGSAEVSVVEEKEGKKIRQVIIRSPEGDEDKLPFVVTSVGSKKDHFLWIDLSALEDEQSEENSDVQKLWTPVAIQKSKQKEGVLTIRLLDTNKVVEITKVNPLEGRINLKPDELGKLLVRDDVWIEGEQIHLQKLPK